MSVFWTIGSVMIATDRTIYGDWFPNLSKIVGVSRRTLHLDPIFRVIISIIGYLSIWEDGWLQVIFSTGTNFPTSDTTWMPVRPIVIECPQFSIRSIRNCSTVREGLAALISEVVGEGIGETGDNSAKSVNWWAGVSADATSNGIASAEVKGRTSCCYDGIDETKLGQLMVIWQEK